ncbi:MAG: hypothetical protein NTY68_04625 [Candidatus Micrarchaeota archaeon]|nr:hypothetical protein [Candidatus Micrarchaeota archaeon]
MKFLSKNCIELDRELSDLDKFALKFINTISKYTDYCIVSGYVSILLGRSRSSEDIDVLIPKMEEKPFRSLVDDLYKRGFSCVNCEKDHAYGYVSSRIAVRFAKKGEVIPNMELKFAKNRIENEAIENRIRIISGKNEFFVSNLELQIAFKERVLKSLKDIEDAKHLRNISKGKLDRKRMKSYEDELDGIYGRK